MKTLTIILIIVLMIGFYTYAHVHRYQVFTVSNNVLIKYDNWIDRTLIYSHTDNAWIELGEQQSELNK